MPVVPSRQLSGFTLIEIIVVIFGFVMISVGVIGLAVSILTSSAQQGGAVSDIDQSRRLAAALVQELRKAVVPIGGSYPLQAAASQQLTFFSDVEEDGVVDRVRYFVQGGSLRKGVIRPSGNPPVYDPAFEQVVEVQKNLANGSDPLFFYYNDTYSGSGSVGLLSQPINVTQVKYVSLRLQVFQKAGVSNDSFYTVTAGGTVRNLKTNISQ